MRFVKRKNSVLFIVLISLCSSTAFAETNNTDVLKFSGLFDGSYNHLSQSNRFTSNTYNRVYDLNKNGFTLQQAAGTASFSPKEGFGFLVNGMLGRDAQGTNPYGLETFATDPDFGLDLTQAFVKYNYSNLAIDVGKFTTLNGAEVVAPTNTSFSRSILFGYAGPFTTLGARATYTVNDDLKFIAGINNGWDSVRDFSRGKTLELSSSYVFSPMFNLALTGYHGKQRITDKTATGLVSDRTLIDAVGTITANDHLSFVINYDYAWQSQATLASGSIGRATWDGVAGYANYKWNDQWRTSLRGELFNDEKGYRTGVAQRWKEITATVGYKPFRDKALEIRAEARRDVSNVSSFLNDRGVNKSHQQSFSLEGVYQFG